MGDTMDNVITFAHDIIKRFITKDSIVIDATVGNGYDTLFLAKHAKHVFGFDVQKQAIENTLEKCKTENINNVTLFLESHEIVDQFVHQSVDAITYNLGYLPNSDKRITTTANTTRRSIENVLPLLNRKGVITITIYTGHEKGEKESDELTIYFSSLNPSLYSVVRYQNLNKIHSPYTVCIQKK